MSGDPSTLKPEIGKKFFAAEAKDFTDGIKRRMYARWDEKIFGGAFMRDLEAGRLPFETIQLFWRHWYSYPVEGAMQSFLIAELCGVIRQDRTPW